MQLTKAEQIAMLERECSILRAKNQKVYSQKCAGLPRKDSTWRRRPKSNSLTFEMKRVQAGNKPFMDLE